MGVVTWKNIAPSNPAGILQASIAAHKALGEGIEQVGTSFKDFSDQKTKRETDDFIADLMSLETQEERDVMIGDANDAWLNLERVNQTNWELGEDARTLSLYNEKLASELAYQTKLSEEVTVPAEIEILDHAATLEPDKDTTKSQYIYGSDPVTNGYLLDAFTDDGKLDTSWHGGGHGFGSQDVDEFVEFRQRFIEEYGDKDLYGDKAITMKQFNHFVNTGQLRWEDTLFGDDFTFYSNGEPHTFDNNKYHSSKIALKNEILALNQKTSYDESKDGAAILKFRENNPTLVDNPATAIDEVITAFYDNNKSTKTLSEEATAAFIAANTPSETTELSSSDSGTTFTLSGTLIQAAQREIKQLSENEIIELTADLIAISDEGGTGTASPLQEEILKQLLEKQLLESNAEK